MLPCNTTVEIALNDYPMEKCAKCEYQIIEEDGLCTCKKITEYMKKKEERK